MNSTGDESEIFRKRTSLPRTPPETRGTVPESWARTSRTMSLPDNGEPHSKAGKKKRQDSSGDESVDEESGKRKKSKGETNDEKVLREVKAVIERVEANAKLMQAIVRATPNIKVELKKAVLEAERLAETLTRKAREWKASSNEERATAQRKVPETQESGTQTLGADQEMADEVEARERIRNAISKGNTYVDFKEIADQEWPKDIYTRVKEEAEDVMALPWEWDLAQLIPEDFCMDSGVARRFRDRYQGLEELQAQQAAVGEVAYLVEYTRIPGKEETVVKEKTRHVYYLVASNGIMGPWDMMDVFHSVSRLKQMATQKGRTRIALAASDRIATESLKKIIEFIFSGTEVDLLLVRERSRRGPITPGIARESKKMRKGAREEAVIIRAEEGRTYADLLQTVKREVNLEAVGVEVSTIRKTRGGDLLLAIRGKPGQDRAASLKAAIQAKMGEVKVMTRREKEVTVHINGVDGVTTAAEIDEAVRGVLGQPNVALKVNAIWPAFGGSQNASERRRPENSSRRGE